MSIVSHIRRIVKPRYYARPTPKVREVRRNSKTTPFAAGLETEAPVLANTPCVLSVFAVEGQPGKCVALTEDEFWFTREEGRQFRYGIVEMAGDIETGYTGSDSLRDAQALVWHLVTPMPQEPMTDLNEPAFPDEINGYIYQPTEEDSLWAAQNLDAGESELDSFLDNAAPDNYIDLEAEGALFVW